MRDTVSKDQVISILENVKCRYEELSKEFEDSWPMMYGKYRDKAEAIETAINEINNL